jgi:hypothetical protein
VSHPRRRPSLLRLPVLLFFACLPIRPPRFGRLSLFALCIRRAQKDLESRRKSSSRFLFITCHGPWVEFSVKEFLKLQENHKIPIVIESGVLITVPKNDTTLLDAVVATAKEHNISIESLDGEALDEHFPQFHSQRKDMIGV